MIFTTVNNTPLFSGMAESFDKKNVLLICFLNLVPSGTRRRCDTPIPCHLHGKWSPLLIVTRHNLRISLPFPSCFVLGLLARMPTHTEPPTLWCILLLSSIGTYLSVYERIYFPLYQNNAALSGLSAYYFLAPYFCITCWYGWSWDLLGVLCLNRTNAVFTYPGMDTWTFCFMYSQSNVSPTYFPHSNPRWFCNFLLELSWGGWCFFSNMLDAKIINH